MKFRKKPVVVEAMQYEASVPSALRIEAWVNSHSKERICVRRDGHLNVIDIFTLEGWMSASVGDWIIKGIEGEFYPCKPEIFEATYEPVEEVRK